MCLPDVYMYTLYILVEYNRPPVATTYQDPFVCKLVGPCTPTKSTFLATAIQIIRS